MKKEIITLSCFLILLEGGNGLNKKSNSIQNANQPPALNEILVTLQDVSTKVEQLIQLANNNCLSNGVLL